MLLSSFVGLSNKPVTGSDIESALDLKVIPPEMVGYGAKEMWCSPSIFSWILPLASIKSISAKYQSAISQRTDKSIPNRSILPWYKSICDSSTLPNKRVTSN
jgi:hypothetical protein